jgi:hypothetical protein
VTAPEGRIDITVSGADALASYLPVDGELVVGTPVPRTNGPVHVTIESDPITGHLTITINGRPALFAFAAPNLAEATTSESFFVDHTSRTTPICDDLQARR